jgi:lipopolysaccharide export system protein LptC
VASVFPSFELGPLFPTRRESIIGGLLVAIALLAWWYSTSRAPETVVAADTQRRPDFVVENLTGLTMGTNGRPARLLATPLLRHYPDDGSSEVETPVITVFSEDAPPWVISSERGWISADGDELLLQGAVRAERASAPDLAPMVLVSSEMLVLPDVDYAETDRFAELERGDDWVTAKDGMQVWFGEQMRVRLFGRNRTLLAPDSDVGGGPDPEAAGTPISDPASDPNGKPSSDPDDAAADPTQTSAR